jgi:hypothetical protein
MGEDHSNIMGFIDMPQPLFSFNQFEGPEKINFLDLKKTKSNNSTFILTLRVVSELYGEEIDKIIESFNANKAIFE